jgi:hypothetical protein
VALVGGPITADALDVMARCPSLAARARVVTELTGGLTNRTYKAATPDGTFLARLWGPGSTS